VVSATRFVRRCKQARVLKLFKYKKKLPCKSLLQPDSSESLQSAGTGLSPYPSTELSGSSRLLAPDPHAEVEKPTERLEGPDHDNVDGAGAAADSVRSRATDSDESQMRKVQSDDHDVVTRRQNLSNEALLYSSEPSMDVLDSRPIESVEDYSGKSLRKDSGVLPERANSKPLSLLGPLAEDPSTLPDWNSSDNNSSEVESKADVPKKLYSVKRRDSGVQPGRGNVKPLTVPGSIAEDLSTLPEWNSSDNNSSEVESKADVPEKLHLYSATKGQIHAAQDTAKVRENWKRIPTEHRGAAEKDEGKYYEDESENWDSPDELASDTAPRPNVATHVPVAATSCQDADNRDDENSSTDELVDSDWSADSSSHQEYARPQQNMSANSSNFVRKSRSAGTSKFNSHEREMIATDVGLAGQAAKRFASVPAKSRPSAVDSLKTWEDFIASFKLDETN